MKRLILVSTVLLCLAATPALADTTPASEVPAKGMVTMLDLGAHKCVPCKMMAPILDELQKEYEGKAAIVFIDVWKNKDVAKKYGIRAIPTQIFYDKSGNEVKRHVGFMDKKSIEAELKSLGVQ
ncbi:thioredoxin family protein [Desulfoluna butyratoxydans]|uniref:Thioredoxin n=1 Tax=Desulfoluna butyratoxydans TaxID=231438 RepID=A0A4U8YJ22_9BACT|nr:thioredoxin family protein [Desulfoluna butyratoxydans]VFQ43274.1 thioredoxin [Desulfoluna butyratoxydans]